MNVVCIQHGGDLNDCPDGCAIRSAALAKWALTQRQLIKIEERMFAQRAAGAIGGES